MIRTAVRTGRQAVQSAAQRRGSAAQALPTDAAAARAKSLLGFPKEVSAELDNWHKDRSPRIPRRARQHVVSSGAEREFER